MIAMINVDKNTITDTFADDCAKFESGISILESLDVKRTSSTPNNENIIDINYLLIYLFLFLCLFLF